MNPIRLRTLPTLAAICALVTTAGVLLAQMPLSQDADGNVWFRTPDGTVLKIGIDGEAAVDGRILVNCRQNPGAAVDLAAGDAQCYGGFFELGDRHGNTLQVYPTIAQAETAGGDAYELPLSRSPVRVRVDLSGGQVRVETDVETVTVGEGDEVAVTTVAGQSVVVDGDDVRIRAAGLEVTGDWRGAASRYGAADTESLLVELGATRQDDLLRLALAGDILFDFGSAAIRNDAAVELAKVAHVIRQRSVGEVYVVGHTDSIGGDDANLTLSRDRAVAVMGWLNRNEGIPPAVMVGRGMGSAKPVAHNTMPDGSDDPAGRARNRRVEILLATREGVDLVDVAGLVRVGAGGVDVGGGAVRVDEGGVDVGGGTIRVDEGGVRVGDVEVTAEGVRIGGVTVGTTGDGGGSRVVGDEAPAVCQTGSTCSFSCPYGDCDMTCDPGAECDLTCTGGDCRMRCRPGADCDFQCTGGDCLFDCAVGSECRTSCTGGGCTRS